MLSFSYFRICAFFESSNGAARQTATRAAKAIRNFMMNGVSCTGMCLLSRKLKIVLMELSRKIRLFICRRMRGEATTTKDLNALHTTALNVQWIVPTRNNCNNNRLHLQIRVLAEVFRRRRNVIHSRCYSSMWFMQMKTVRRLAFGDKKRIKLECTHAPEIVTWFDHRMLFFAASDDA